MLEIPGGRSTVPQQLRVAVIGSGPSGVYTAQSLLAAEGADPPAGTAVDIFDRLPCPYGLVRYGVAPDHEKIKSLQQNLRGVLEHPRVRFLGNVTVGEGGIAPRELLDLYHAVVYCVGAATDRRLGIPGEDLPGSYAATDFVAWYSAHPDASAHDFRLGTTRAAVVIGVGNVALDVARVLARTGEELEATDMPQGPLDSLASDSIRTIHLVGRRGPSQAKFTTKELRELGTLPAATPSVREAELALDPYVHAPEGLPANARRNVAVLQGWSDARENATGADHTAGAVESPAVTRHIALRFYLRPVAVLGQEEGRVRGVRFERTVPDGAEQIRGTGEFEDIEAGLVLRSVGYRGVPLAGLPFDARTHTVPHEHGRVLREGVRSPGEYVAGWIKRGPTGVIGSNRPCAKETVTSLLEDRGALTGRQLSSGDPLDALRRAGHELVEWPGWLAIERAEVELGHALRRRTVKIPDWSGLLTAAQHD